MPSLKSRLCPLAGRPYTGRVWVPDSWLRTRFPSPVIPSFQIRLPARDLPELPSRPGSLRIPGMDGCVRGLGGTLYRLDVRPGTGGSPRQLPRSPGQIATRWDYQSGMRHRPQNGDFFPLRGMRTFGSGE